MYQALYVKTNYSLLSSLIKIDDYIDYAKKHNLTSLAITDNNMFATMEFFKKCKSNNIKPIIGLELTYNNNIILLYAKNYNGYKSLIKLTTISSSRNIELDDLKTNNKEVIAIIPFKYMDIYKELENVYEDIYLGYSNKQEEKEALLFTKNIVFLRKNLYIKENEKEYLKYLYMIRDGKTISDEVEYDIDNHYLDISDIYEYTSNENLFTASRIADMCNLEFPDSKLLLPIYADTNGLSSFEYLKELASFGLNKRLEGKVRESYITRLNYELEVIDKMGFSNYFLVVYDFIKYAKKNNILVGPGRGSAAASLVTYALGIINVDPLKYDLIFERFLNPERITMPDIDIDFDNMKREEVIEYVTNKYGSSKTARIISFNTLLPKQVIRDVGRVLKISNIIIDRITNTIKDEKDFESLKDNYEYNRAIRNNEEINRLIDISTHLCGLKKNTSIHAAGVVISDIDLDTIMPLYKSNNMILTGYDMDYIESLGLLKMDFLSIKNLNIISNIINDIKSDGIDLDINNIDLNDKKTLDLFKNAYTTGIFQFESDGMKSFLKNLEVDSFSSLVDAIALYRPGPREMIPEYIARKKGKKKITYLIKELEPILKSTYGIIIYQEQVLEILKKIGGFSYGEADIIRRAMSKKKLDLMNKEKEKFIDGVKKLGYDDKIGYELFDQIVKFASYGFNKSHSVVYSLVAFQMAYLKINYTLYFMKNILNMNSSSEKLKEYIDESKILGIEFENISINKSCYEFIIDNNKLILPFKMIKSIALNVSKEIESERLKGKFKSFYDFMIRCYHGSINKKVIISLIDTGVFDEFNINKKQMVLNIDEVLNYVNLCKDLNLVLDNPPVFEEISDYDDKEMIENEINYFGFYLSHHPVTKYDRDNSITLNDYKKYFDKTITTILYVESVKTIKTKNNEKMSFIRLSDEYDSVDGILFPDQYKKIGEVERNNVYKINAHVEKRNNTYQLIIYNMILLSV